MWGIAMPVAARSADRYSARTVMVTGALMVSAATALTPLAHSTGALIVLHRPHRRDRAGAMGPGLIMSALARWVPEAKRNVATGIVNAGGSFRPIHRHPLAGRSSGSPAGSRDGDHGRRQASAPSPPFSGTPGPPRTQRGRRAHAWHATTLAQGSGRHRLRDPASSS